ncbi:MAG TPA: hypothetical protein VGO47_01935 [Chlamydiales bacterium]|nr:hypothetical protein [Chlamydiales bacterium]
MGRCNLEMRVRRDWWVVFLNLGKQLHAEEGGGVSVDTNYNNDDTDLCYGAHGQQ